MSIIDDYIQRGFNVIPLADGSKAPPDGLRLEKYFTERMPQDEIERYNPKNIGLVTGRISNLVVVDVDDVSKRDKYMSQYPTGTMVETPSGGLHLYYRMPTFPIPAIGRLENQVEIFAGRHYVVAPPSYVKASRAGRHYQGYYRFIKQDEPSEFPLAYAQQLLQGSTGEVTNGKYSRTEIKALVDYVLRNGTFLAGSHNDTIFYGAMYMAGDGTPRHIIEQIMLAADSRDPSPQGEAKVRDMITRALAHYAKPIPAPLITQPPSVDYRMVTYDDMINEYHGKQTSWLVDGWMLESSIMMLAAPPESFKTWLSLDLAFSVATGVPFMGQFAVNKTGPVLIFQQEDYGLRLYKRMEMIEAVKRRERGDTLQDVLAPIPIYLHPDGMLALDRPESLVFLKQQIAIYRPALVIIDPFYSLTITDDYFATAAALIRQEIKPLRNEYGTAFLFVHHTKKGVANGTDGLGREQTYGSQFVNAVMEGMITARRIEGRDEEIELGRRFKDAPAQANVSVKFDIKGDVYRVDARTGLTDEEQRILDFLADNGPSTLTEVFTEMRDIYKHKPSLSRKLAIMEQRGLVVKEGRKFVGSLDNGN